MAQISRTWRKLIRGILSSTRTYILLIGSPTSEFNVYGGVQQGNPLSILLFILAMEALHVATKSACYLGIFHGLQTPQAGSMVPHLLFADNVMFVITFIFG
ncbi:hypothetical protein HanIR_Chr09g0423891 [Helianthus annuus]|nr:hypothetical protein HanIR_Chr09g0423891 [Helianthus annuus]